MIRKPGAGGKANVRPAADNVAHASKKPQQYRQHEAITDMIDKANDAIENNQLKD
ncbi:MAG: hypothetical protein P4L75_03625 [Clostridia bacterium]|nr:hypothetical protein [Clostridia bacterium]MDR3643522.1 hypothetical protein [Clostridia bacterium]